MAFVLSAGLTQTACDELLQLICVFLPSESLLPSTKYLLKKYFMFKNDASATIYYCPHCSTALDKDLFCSTCNLLHEKHVLNKNHNFFLYLPLVPQLLNLLEARGFGDKLRLFSPLKSANGVCDISDGRKYNGFMDGILTKNQNTISLTFNTDGVPLFKSSSFSIWPLQSFVNELPASKRKSNFLLSGLWFGNSKPSLSTFLKPFSDELQVLGTLGFQWIKNGVRVHSLVFAVACCCDSVARAMLQNIMQFNGLYGCSWCHSPGQQVKKGKGSVRVYQSKNDFELRSDETVRNCAKDAHRTGKAVLGVKGPSPLSLLPGFDMACGFVVDYMHCVDLGLTRQMSHMWFDSKYHNRPWYIGKSIAKIDEHLLNMMPPSNVTRAPRSLLTRAYWKANEWRAFLLFYAPVVLRDVLPERFYHHMVQISAIMFSLQSDFISRADIDSISTCIQNFVSNFEMLYGVEHMSYNVHLLLHMADSVRDWGPIWCYSAYSFESANGLFLKLFHGTQSVGKQIVLSFLLMQRIYEMIPSTICDVSHPTFLKLLSKFVSTSDLLNKKSGFSFLGNPVIKYATLNEVLCIELFLGYSVSKSMKSYKKIIVERQIYFSYEYSRSTKRCNSVVLLADGSIVLITDFVHVEAYVSSEVCEICLVKPIEFIVLQNLHGNNCAFVDHVKFVSKVDNRVRVCRPMDIVRKCVVHMVDNDLNAVALLPSYLEND